MNDKKVIAEMLAAIGNLYLLNDRLQDESLKNRISSVLHQTTQRITESAESAAFEGEDNWDSFFRDKEKYLAP
jgi:hypothetical protein